ncbi:MAG TPA: sigma-70 family RNA polymerase sigma factor [Anaerolineae bacterium]|nr:sigma-70 family RNA polymerase sigma factor [Anaerolineae bacterium]
MSAAHEDELLVARMREGDLAALGELYDKYRLQVFHAALAITRDRQVAEDILQECFLKLHAHAGHLDGRLPLAPWLYRVTVNLAYTWVSRHARWWTSLEGLVEKFDRLIAPARAAPEHQLELRDLQASIQRAIEALPFNRRVVVILHYLGGLDLKEIAYILDCPIGTVKSRLHYGREALRTQLASSVAPEAAPALEMAYEFK